MSSRPDCSSAVFASWAMPKQHGTSMWATVTDLTELPAKMRVSFSM